TFGTFSVQNRLSVAASCRWQAQHIHSVQRPTNQAESATFGPIGGAALPPLPFVGGGGGEVNTASNIGAGVGVFASKLGADLQFKSLVAGLGITLTPSGNEIEIESAGGGGGDIRPNRITVGNSAEGDTANTCDFLFDTTDL